ncbi:MAG: hypothetical protein CMJ81_04765 [Planctomycetaceae bacterium]|nr:hypothetical protein [Planctomycetaceae bacterium]MBP61734.1 hypothetical protein [Planctomycetaceae bacterium]
MRQLALVFVFVTCVATVRASVTTTGDVVPGGAAAQPDPWAVGGSLKVGNWSNGTLNVETGGMVSSTKGYIGYQAGSTGEAVVTGASSQWNNSVAMYVGVVGDGALKVEAGGMVSNTKGYIGYHAGSTGEATITGTDSRWNNSVELYVGVVSHGTLKVEAGGMVSNTKGYIGYHAGSTGEATVTGTSSHWNNSGELQVGVVGDGTLNVETGGMVSNSSSRIGDHADSTGSVTVTGTDSQWNNSDRLVVGRHGDGTLIVEAEGFVSNSLGLIGRYSNSTGLVTVSGASSQWSNSGGLHVGWYGDGTLDVRAGGMVSTTSGYIGRYSGSTGMATVTGADSQWNHSNSLNIGGGSSAAGGSGTLNIRDSGLVTVSDTTRLWDEGSVTLDGGTLDTVTLDLTVGTFNMLDGILRATNVTGTLNNQGGTLSPGNSPGILTITGDYTQGAAATMEIELAGTAAGDFDRLTSSGSANLDGTLDLLPVPAYSDPSVHGTFDEFVIITGAVRSGTFSTVQYAGSTLAADFGTDGSGSFRSYQGGGLFRSVSYTATTVQLQNLLALAGDTDGDQDVDLADYSALANNFDPVGFLGPHSWLDGDFDGDNDVDLADYSSLASHFNPAGYAAAAVPEPTAFCLLVSGLLLLVGTRSRRPSCGR